MKIYLAGKISKNGWRNSIVTGLREAIFNSLTHDDRCSSSSNNAAVQSWPILHRSIFSACDYVGPYFTSCDHGCYHGPDSHGVVREGCGGEWETDNHGNSLFNDKEARKAITISCLEAIQRCDVVFTWFHRPDVYGTLAELGYAAALSKRIWIATPTGESFPDHWFAFQLAEYVVQMDTPRDALRHLLFCHGGVGIDGYVYLLRSGTHYKIGKSKNVDQRVTQISPKTPLPIELIHHIPTDNMAQAEAQLHQRYAQYRTNGEWFKLPHSEVAWLKTLPAIYCANGRSLSSVIR